MDATALISSFSTGTYTVSRRVASTYTKGNPVSAIPSTFTIDAAVIPATGKDLQRLPEGRRAIESKTVYTPTLLYTGGQGEANEADWISIDSANWEVQHVETWEADASFYVCVVQKAMAVAES
jgi:hypothetical protein